MSGVGWWWGVYRNGKKKIYRFKTEGWAQDVGCADIIKRVVIETTGVCDVTLHPLWYTWPIGLFFPKRSGRIHKYLYIHQKYRGSLSRQTGSSISCRNPRFWGFWKPWISKSAVFSKSAGFFFQNPRFWPKSTDFTKMREFCKSWNHEV